MLPSLLFAEFSLASDIDDSEIRHIEYPAWFEKNPFNDLSEMTRKVAEKSQKGLFILFTTEGCSYCDHFIRKSLGDSDIASIMKTNFVSVGLEIFDDADMVTPSGKDISIKQYATDEKVQFSPTILFYDGEGKRILRLTGYQSPQRFKNVLDYVINDHYRSISFRDYLLRKKTDISPAEARKAITKELTPNPNFEKPPYMLDRSHYPASNPLLVLFEETDCLSCINFHSEVLTDKDVTQSIKNFEVIRINAKDDKTIIIAPNGQKTTPAKWYMTSDFSRAPALLFFDENGNEVLKTDALVLRQRMLNSMNYVTEKAYKRGWTYQRFARSKAIEKYQK